MMLCGWQTVRDTDRQTGRESERWRGSTRRDTAPHSGAVLYGLQTARGNIDKKKRKKKTKQHSWALFLSAKNEVFASYSSYASLSPLFKALSRYYLLHFNREPQVEKKKSLCWTNSWHFKSLPQDSLPISEWLNMNCFTRLCVAAFFFNRLKFKYWTVWLSQWCAFNSAVIRACPVSFGPAVM